MSGSLPTSARFKAAPSGILIAALSILGCGSTAGSLAPPGATGGTNGSGGTTVMGTGGVGAGGSPGSAGMNTGGASGGSAGSTPTGPGDVAPPLVDISGRWGMFGFEDPVGVALVQAADGTLSGRGCVAGAPGSSGPDMLVFPELCGPVTGEVRGRSASFGFTFPLTVAGTRYATRVTVSNDSRRMTGLFGTAESDLFHPVGWLPVASDSSSLPYKSGPYAHASAFGAYQLTLVADESVGTEFVAGPTYLLVYDRGSITGDLGLFWQSEVSTAGGAVRAGPVPPTALALPVALALELTSDAIRRVGATTASGGRYTFTAARRP